MPPSARRGEGRGERWAGARGGRLLGGVGFVLSLNVSTDVPSHTFVLPPRPSSACSQARGRSLQLCGRLGAPKVTRPAGGLRDQASELSDGKFGELW